MRLDVFDFDLPPHCIALRPVRPRHDARLFCVDPQAQPHFTSKHVHDLPKLLRAGDALVFNNTKVLPAEMHGVRERKGGLGEQVNVTFNLFKRINNNQWRAFVRPARRLKAGDKVHFSNLLHADVIERTEAEALLQFSLGGEDLDKAITDLGQMPLPPYIASKREADEKDIEDYQTVFARRVGSVAAPTAGLHFTEGLLDEFKVLGISQHFITLHVGAGTFLPVKTEDVEQHVMHPEWGEISAETAASLNETRAKGGRIIAVGTTSLRILESAAQEDGTVRPYSSETSIFITPGYKFRAVDRLITNFHLPRSTLFMLVCAFSGLDVMKQGYKQAIENGYRFYSYGDACFLSPMQS